MPTPHERAAQNEDANIAALKELLRIPSVSTQDAHRADIRRAAGWIHERLTAIGFLVEIHETPRHPVVVGRWTGAGSDAPTLLIYGHYDVQPPDPVEEWVTPPFEPDLRDGSLYARGASDDKGQLFVHIAAIEAILAADGTLPVNVTFVVEGEEEIGSPNLGSFVLGHADLLAADAALVSDTHIRGLDHPTIVYSLRGLLYTQLDVSGPRGDLHSGHYGGAIHNPAQALTEIIASMHDEDGAVAVPGFYDAVLPLQDDERADIARIPYSEDTLLDETGAPAAWGEPEYSVSERIGGRPTLEVNGLISGYTEPGAKTVLPAQAMAKISCRLVANQDPDTIFELVRRHIETVAPPTVRWELTKIAAGKAALTDRNAPVVQAAVRAYQEHWGTRPDFVREGGSIPVVAVLQDTLGVPVVLMGFGLPDDNLHAPNEKFSLECFRRGVATSIGFIHHVGSIQS